MINTITITNAENKLRESARAGLALFDLSNVNDVETLSAVALYAKEATDKTQLSQAKAIAKIRAIFAQARAENAAKNKARAKGEKPSKVNIYGCETFVEYAENVLHIPKSTANTLANLARLLDASGLHSVFYGQFGESDFGFAQLLKISPFYKTNEKGEVTKNAVTEYGLTPAMTVTEISAILNGKMRDISDETEVTESTSESTPQSTSESTPQSTSESTAKQAPKEAKAETMRVFLAPSAWREVLALLDGVDTADAKLIATAIREQVKL